MTLAKAKARRRHSGFIGSEDWWFIATKALDQGGRIARPGTVEWNVAGKCTAPIHMELRGVQHNLYGHVEARELQHPTRYIDMEVPCRKCANCLWRKALHWMHRSSMEIEVSPRTWLVTLTFNATIRARIRLGAIQAVGAEAFGQLSREQRSKKLADQANKYVTLWMKRVRKDTGPGVRYVSVIELHKDGTPHGHLLVHEAREGQVLHRHLTDQWTYGFSNAKLVEDGPIAARYVAKYLAKSPISRVRASVGYGQTPGQIRP